MNARFFKCLLICLVLNSCGFTQTLTAKESGQIELAVYKFFNISWEKRANYGNTAPSEAFLCLLDIDSDGKISDVHLLADERNKDSAFAIFSRMRPSDFGDWQVKKCQGKTILIPITIIALDKPKYVKDLDGLNAFKPGETKNLIIIRPVSLGWPKSEH